MSCKNIIMQGDQYQVPFHITINNEDINLEEVSSIQFVIGDLIKYYKKDNTGTVIYNAEDKNFYFPISQEESLNLEGSQDSQVRVKFVNGIIQGKKIGNIDLMFSLTKEEV